MEKEIIDASKKLKALQEQQLLQIQENISKLDCKELKNFLSLATKQAIEGKLNIEEFTKTITQWQKQ